MDTKDFEQLGSVYHIYEDLTPDKSLKTYVAFTNHTDVTKPVILKELDPKRACIYQALTNMWNPYIANVYSVHPLPNSTIQEGSSSMETYLAVTENAGNTSLSDYVRQNGPLSLRDSLSICAQLCDGLMEFHKRGFVHRDIKPENIMISSHTSESPHIKIIDFGGAKEYQQDKASDTTVIGTLGYQAPESLSAVTRETADIFSIGCVLNFMLTGHEPAIQWYTGRKSIIHIIEKAAHVDPSSRYPSVGALKKDILHELNFYIFDRIPVIRSIPGFRTHTRWKMLLASFVYITALYITASQWFQKLYYESLEMLTFYLLIPLIIICNLGNLLQFIPANIRRSSRKFLILRIICILIAFCIPLIRVGFFS